MHLLVLWQGIAREWQHEPLHTCSPVDSQRFFALVQKSVCSGSISGSFKFPRVSSPSCFDASTFLFRSQMMSCQPSAAADQIRLVWSSSLTSLRRPGSFHGSFRGLGRCDAEDQGTGQDRNRIVFSLYSPSSIYELVSLANEGVLF